MALFVLVRGAAYSGKDTVSDILAEDHGFSRGAFAKKLKLIYGELFGVDGARMISDPSYKTQQRRGLIWFGKMARTHDEDVWVNQVERFVTAAGIEKIAVSDFRLSNEYCALKSKGHRCLSLRVLASDEVRKSRMGSAAWEEYQKTTRFDPSERALDKWVDDIEVENNGTSEDLKSRVQKLVPALLETTPREHGPEEVGQLDGVLDPSYELLEEQVKNLKSLVSGLGVTRRVLLAHNLGDLF